MKEKHFWRMLACMIIIPMLSGCWTLVAAGAGAYGGYKMKEKGYTVQSPIAKEKNKQ